MVPLCGLSLVGPEPVKNRWLILLLTMTKENLTFSIPADLKQAMISLTSVSRTYVI